MTDDNFLEHDRDLREFVEGFDFTIPGKDSSLGKDLATKVAETIRVTSVNGQKSPDFQPWRANSPAWTAYKKKKTQNDAIGYWTGQMLSFESLLGQVTIAPARITMVYGTGEPAAKFFDGQPYPPPSDERRKTYKLAQDLPTDRQKAQWFTDGGREFYAFGDVTADLAIYCLEDALEEYISREFA